MVDVALSGLTPSSTGGSQVKAGTSRLKKLQERLQSRTSEEGGFPRGSLGGIFHLAQDNRGHNSLDNRGQFCQGSDGNPRQVGILSFQAQQCPRC